MKRALGDLTAAELRVRALFAAFVAAFVASIGCSAPPQDDDVPPDFNAVDTSLTCPAGQIGWDYSTGGASEEDAVNGGTLSGIRIKSARYAPNAVGVSVGNIFAGGGVTVQQASQGSQTVYDEEVASKCNGEYYCDYAFSATKGDPASAAAAGDKYFQVYWTCGTESPVYQRLIPGNASGKNVVLTCGPQMTIKTATWGQNCSGVPLGNYTDAVKKACDTTRNCDYLVTGPDPKPGCDENFVAEYTCGENPKVNRFEIANAGGRTASFRCDGLPDVTITEATLGGDWCANPRVATGQHTAPVAAKCNGKTSCDFAISDLGDPSNGCCKRFTAKYKCGQDPKIYTYQALETWNDRANPKCVQDAIFSRAKITCAGNAPYAPPTFTSSGKKGCITKDCAWNTKRDATMACTTDTTKPYVDSFKLLSYKLVDYTDRVVRDIGIEKKVAPITGNTPYKLNAQIAMAGPALDTRLTAWFTDRYENKTSKAQTDGFVCVAANLGVHKEHAGLQRLTTSTFSDIFSQECTNLKRTSAQDAAFRLGMKESDFRQAYTLVGTKLHFSFDPEGKAGFSPTGQSQTKVTAPNPIGFFFDAKKGWVDQISYYQQRELPAFDDGTRFDKRDFAITTPQVIEFLTQGDITVRDGATLPLRLFSIVDPPPLSIDFDWAMIGDSINNPYSPTVPNGALGKANPRISVSIFPGGKDNEALPLGSPIPLTDGNATGNLTTAKFKLGTAAKDRIFTEWLAYDTFDVRTCIQIDGLDSTDRAPSQKYLGIDYSMQINSGLKCRTVKDAIFVVRDLINRPIEPQHPNANLGNTKDNASGDQKSSGDAQNGQEQNCIETGTGANRKTICTTVQTKTSSGEGGTGSRTFYSSESGTTLVNTNGQMVSTVDDESEALGFQIVDQGDDDPKSKLTFDKEGDYPKGTNWEVKIAPNLDLLIETLHKAPEPEFKKGTYGGRIGIGVGLAYKIPMNFGPVPVLVILTASVGVSIELVFKGNFKPDNPYPCTNTTGTKCFQVVDGTESQKSAAKSCAVKGGRLAEMVSANDRAAIAFAATGSKNYWVGGQAAYDYGGSAGDCYRRPGDADCKNSSKTSWRWTGSDTEFARSTGNSATLTLTPGGTVVPLTDISFTPAVPLAVGVTYHGVQKKLGSQVQTQTMPYVCEYDGASKALYTGFSAALNLGAAAGFSVEACSPSDEIGICIGGTINVIDFSIAPTLSHDSFILFGNENFPGTTLKKPIGRRANSHVGVPWELKLFTGELAATAHFFVGSATWKIASWDGFIVDQGSLYDYDYPTREVY